jgi:ATP-dependent RNA helicase DDX42
MFSATFKKKVERIAREILTDPVRVHVGNIGDANTDITQMVEVLDDPSKKLPWLKHHLAAFVKEGSVLIFAGTKQNCELLVKEIVGLGFHGQFPFHTFHFFIHPNSHFVFFPLCPAAAIHGDKDQAERTKIMFAFKNQNLPILVATDVAGQFNFPLLSFLSLFPFSERNGTFSSWIGREISENSCELRHCKEPRCAHSSHWTNWTCW